MPLLERADGTTIHWESRGSGPAAILVDYWSGHPGVYRELLTNLAGDHRVVTYDARGTGRSSRHGPWDMETTVADLEAVIEAVGTQAVLMATADGSNRAVHAAANRSDLVAAVFTFGVAPLPLRAFSGGEGMIGSQTVVDAFVETVERDYRGALRALLTATNPQMSAEELRERVAFQSDYCPRDTAAGRIRAWLEDDPGRAGQSLGNHLWVLTAPDVAGPWLPDADELERRRQELLPEARVVTVEDGPISSPEPVANLIREVTLHAPGSERRSGGSPLRK